MIVTHTTVINVIISGIVILLMMMFYRKMGYIIAFSLFTFTVPIIGGEFFSALRWSLYTGLIVTGIIYGQRHTVRKVIPPDLILFFFAGAIMLSYFVSIDPPMTLKRGFSVGLMYFALFFGLYTYITDVDKIYKILRGMVLFVIVYNILSIIPGMIRLTATGRLAGLSGHPGGTSIINVSILPIAFMNYIMDRRRINLLPIIFIIACMYFTYSRAGIITMISSFILFYGLYFRNTKVIFIFIALLTVATIFISFFTFGIWLPERLVRLENLPVLGGRLEAWAAAREIIAKRPFFGFGFGTEEFLSSHFGITFFHHSGAYFHNSFLGLALQIGVPATIIFFSIIVYFTISTFRFIATIEDAHYRLLGITLANILFIGLMYCFSESWIYSAGNILAFIYFIAVVLVLRFKNFVREQNVGA